MHIVIDARQLRTTTGRYVERLLRYLQDLDKNNDYTVLLRPGDYESWEASSPRFHKALCPHKEFTLAEQFGLLRQLHRINPDLVHFPMVQQPVLYLGRVVTTMNDLTTTRFRNTAKNPVIFWAKQQLYKLLNIIVAKKSVALLTYTSFVKHDVINYTRSPESKFTVTPLAADKLSPSIAMPSLLPVEFLLYVGKPMTHKNLGRLIDAFVELQRQRPELHLVLAGKKDANYARHEARVQRENIPNVIFTDFVSDGQLRWLYEHCAAYVFPSLSEGFGLPGLEAMVHGAPVVSSNATCLPEVYGDAAHYFDPLDVSDMAAKIGEVLDDETLRSNLIERGRAQAAKYSWRRTAQQTLAIYEKALKDV